MAVTEGLVLSSTDLNDGTNYSLRGIDFTPPKKRQEWVQGADADGAALVRDPLMENRTITLRLRIPTQSTMDIALGTKVGALVDLLEEAEKQTDGITLVWTPAQGTKSYTLYVLSGEVTALPIEKANSNSGYFQKAPMVELRLDCKPFGYGAAVSSAATVTNTDPVQLLTLAGVTGDVPAEARLVVTDAATQSRRHVEWGLQQRYYDAATSLLIDSDSLVTTGFGGAGTTRSGAYDPGAAGNSVIRATLTSSPVAVCGTGVLANVGTFRVKARVFAASSASYVRFTWQDGDGSFSANQYDTAIAGVWSEVDLGLITITEKQLGTQKWSGRVDAYVPSSLAPTDTLDVDYIVLIPTAEGYGKARGVYTYSAGATVARDEFTSIAAATVLNARAAPTGGNWATSGAATDLAAADAPTGTEETESRATTADAAGGRFAILGATSYTDTEVVVSHYRTAAPTATFYQGAIARWVDASNHLRVVQYLDNTVAVGGGLKVSKVIAGVVTDLLSLDYTTSNSTWYRVRVVVFASGLGIATLLDAAGNTLTSGSFQDTTLATGGTLATGKPGFVDYNGSATATTRYYDNFSAATPAAEPIVVYSGRAAEIRHDSAIRQDSTGTYYGAMPIYRGSRFLLPPAGSAARTSRVLVKARRNDVDTSQDDQIADSTTATIHYTPRYLVIPR